MKQQAGLAKSRRPYERIQQPGPHAHWLHGTGLVETPASLGTMIGTRLNPIPPNVAGLVPLGPVECPRYRLPWHGENVVARPGAACA